MLNICLKKWARLEHNSCFCAEFLEEILYKRCSVYSRRQKMVTFWSMRVHLNDVSAIHLLLFSFCSSAQECPNLILLELVLSECQEINLKTSSFVIE